MIPMKNIKFRAWSEDTHEMVQVARLDIKEETIYYENGIKSLNREQELDFWWKPYVLMQYTGLKDTKGVEIYEGDYVVGTQYLTTSPNVPFEINGVVRYSEITTMFYIDVKNKGHNMFMHSLGSTPYNLEVIGNIYQNNDLLYKGVVI